MTSEEEDAYYFLSRRSFLSRRVDLLLPPAGSGVVEALLVLQHLLHVARLHLQHTLHLHAHDAPGARVLAVSSRIAPY